MATDLESVAQHVRAIIDRLLTREGVLNKVHGDKGGFTQFGITARFLSEYIGRAATEADIMALTRDDAYVIYNKMVWEYERIEGIYKISPRIAELVFDWCVNSGTNLGIMKLQDFIGVARDGSLGPVTLSAILREIDKHGEINFCHHFLDYRVRSYIRICEKDRSQIKFLEGWFNRATKLRYASL